MFTMKSPKNLNCRCGRHSSTCNKHQRVARLCRKEATNDLPLSSANLAATPCIAYCTVQFSWLGGYPKQILQKIWELVLAVYHSRDQRQNTQPVEQEDHVCNCVKKTQDKFPYQWLWTVVGQGPRLANTKGLVVLFWYPSEQVKPQMTCPKMTK